MKKFLLYLYATFVIIVGSSVASCGGFLVVASMFSKEKPIVGIWLLILGITISFPLYFVLKKRQKNSDGSYAPIDTHYVNLSIFIIILLILVAAQIFLTFSIRSSLKKENMADEEVEHSVEEMYLK